jgi:protein gp37
VTTIEWTDKSWNPIVGCSIISPGCTNCYAMKMAARLERMMPEGNHYGGLTRMVNGKPVWTGKLAMAPDHILTEPLRRRKPTMWFVNSMSDLFHEDVPDEWIDRVFAVMALAPQHTFQVLTKRSKRMREYMRALQDGERRLDVDFEQFKRAYGDAKNFPFAIPNVWLGVSAEDQRRADERIPDLLATPAAVRFISAEPLLGPVRFDVFRIPPEPMELPFINALTGHRHGWPGGVIDGPTNTHFITEAPVSPKLDWIIVGGESTSGARPMDKAWAQSIVDQCKAAGVAAFVKQLSSGGPKAIKDMALFPEGLRVRDMPEVR